MAGKLGLELEVSKNERERTATVLQGMAEGHDKCMEQIIEKSCARRKKQPLIPLLFFSSFYFLVDAQPTH